MRRGLGDPARSSLGSDTSLSPDSVYALPLFPCLSDVCRSLLGAVQMNRNRSEPARTGSGYPDLAVWVAI